MGYPLELGQQDPGKGLPLFNGCIPLYPAFLLPPSLLLYWRSPDCLLLKPDRPVHVAVQSHYDYVCHASHDPRTPFCCFVDKWSSVV